jgi:hypothetical protein
MAPGIRHRTGFPSLQHFHQRDKWPKVGLIWTSDERAEHVIGMGAGLVELADHITSTSTYKGQCPGRCSALQVQLQNAEQQRRAERVKARVEASGRWRLPITTTIEQASTWYSAEGYHQDYLQKNAGGYACHFLRE